MKIQYFEIVYSQWLPQQHIDHDELLCDLVTLDKETSTGLSVAIIAAVSTLSGVIIILIVAATFCLYQWKCSERYYVCL